MLENSLLDSQQKDLLATLVEAYRNLQQRSNFLFCEMLGITQISHEGLPNESFETNKSDINSLCYEGLILFDGENSFFITPKGFKYYEEMKEQMDKPLQKIEQSIINFLDSNRFQQKYSKAYQKWVQAEKILWASDSVTQLTTIGHLCREALQELASALIDQYQLPNNIQEKVSTVKRLKTVIREKESQFGKSEKEFLDALVAYWGTVSDLIQRQEHGGQKENEPLVWEDGRRVVFQTAIVMFEVDKSLSKSKSV